MSEKELPPYRAIISAWAFGYNNKIPTGPSRCEAYRDLFMQLIENGYGRDDITISLKNEIIRKSVNPYSKKRVRWEEVVERDIEGAFNEMLPITKKREITAEEKAQAEERAKLNTSTPISDGKTVRSPSEILVVPESFKSSVVHDYSIFDQLGWKKR